MNIPLLGPPPKEESLISTPALQVAKKTRPDPCPMSLDPRPTPGPGPGVTRGVHSRSQPWDEGMDIEGYRARKWDAGVLGDTYG